MFIKVSVDLGEEYPEHIEVFLNTRHIVACEKHTIDEHNDELVISMSNGAQYVVNLSQPEIKRILDILGTPMGS